MLPANRHNLPRLLQMKGIFLTPKLFINLIKKKKIFPNFSCRRRSVPQEIDRDENVNGRHGTFSKLIPERNGQLNSTNPTIPKRMSFYNDSQLSMAAFRGETVRANSKANRQRQLESLRRMEERIQRSKIQTKQVKKTENTLSIFVLDITNVLCDDCTASWVSLKQNGQSGPDERILYSLALGRGELIVFGGIRKERTTIQGRPDIDDSEVYNDLYFINPPRYVI